MSDTSFTQVGGLADENGLLFITGEGKHVTVREGNVLMVAGCS